MQDEAPAVNAEPAEVVPGDANRSGAADVSDAVALTKYLYGAGILKAPAAVDLNKDGKLTAADLTLLKRMLLSLRKEETV